jgi:hypothetical protein
MQFDRNDVRTRGKQSRGDGTGPRTDVEHKFARLDARILDEPSRPLVSEPIPAPSPA